MEYVPVTRELTPEEKALEKKKMLATIKAQNQMLEDVKNNLIAKDESEIDPAKYSDTPLLSKEEKIRVLEAAQMENLQVAKEQLGADPSDVDAASYSGPDVAAVKAYERKLKMRGLTHEQIANKKLADTDMLGDDGVQAKEGGTTKKRRARKTKESKEAIKTDTAVVEDKTVPVAEIPPAKVEEKRESKAGTEDNVTYDFDLSSIPDCVQYDIIPLPSNGECYSHKKGRLPVAYITGADENIILSPNMYRDGKLIDVLLERKILDKSINVDELCVGDREAIALWLRATAYGDDFPIVVTNPNTGKQTDMIVKLSKFKSKDFKLKGDENGHFEYRNGKDVIKFKFLTRDDELELSKIITDQVSDYDKIKILRNAVEIKDSLTRVTLSDEDLSNLREDVDEIMETISETVLEKEGSYPMTITEQMIMHTVSVNGNTDREYIRGYMENMRAMDAKAYRDYFRENRPGMDMRVRVNVDESDGGGSFDTFLGIEDSIFITY